MKKNNSILLSTPYVLWMLLFTLIPLGVVAYYALTDPATGEFTLENMNIYTILEEMKKKKISRALICDEFGACSGLITLKDILEALIGEVDDDHDKEEDIVERQEGEGWFVNGTCTMYDFLSYFEMEDDMEDFEYTTVAGLILDRLGHIPVVGECTEWGDFSFEVVDMDGPRIDKIILKKKED